MLQREGYVPVWLESGLLDLYYNGFCNSVLWQLFHYVPLQLDGWQRVQEHQTLQMQWGAYQQVCGSLQQVPKQCILQALQQQSASIIPKWVLKCLILRCAATRLPT